MNTYHYPRSTTHVPLVKMSSWQSSTETLSIFKYDVSVGSYYIIFCVWIGTSSLNMIPYPYTNLTLYARICILFPWKGILCYCWNSDNYVATFHSEDGDLSYVYLASIWVQRSSHNHYVVTGSNFEFSKNWCFLTLGAYSSCPTWARDPQKVQKGT